MDFDDQSYDIIGAAKEVHSELGPGLRKKHYANAMVIALREKGLSVEPQRAYPIVFHDQVVGECIPDITVDSDFLVETKSIEELSDSEIAQTLNYLRISEIEVGLVINFKNPKLEWKRVALRQQQ